MFRENKSDHNHLFSENLGGDEKIDLSFSFRTSPPDFYVGKKNLIIINVRINEISAIK